MSIAASMWAWQQKLSNPRHKILLLKLADSANDEGFCWPYVKTLASDCNMSKSSVTRATRALEEAGLLTIRERYKQDGSRGANMYLLHVNGEIPTLEGGHVSSDTTSPQSRDAARTVREPSREPTPERRGGAAPAAHLDGRRWSVPSSREGVGPFTVDLEAMTCNCENRHPTVCRHIRAAQQGEGKMLALERKALGDAVWDALVEVYGEPAERQRGARGAARRDIIAMLDSEGVEATPERYAAEVKRRYEALAADWGAGKATMHALVVNWSVAGKLAARSNGDADTSWADRFLKPEVTQD